MSWARIDDLMPESLKIAPLSDAAFRAYVTSICYSARNLTDGFIPDRKAREFAGRAKVIQELAPALWELVEGGFVVHDYLHYNPTREQVMAERQEKHEAKVRAGRAGGLAKASRISSSTVAEGLAKDWQKGSPDPLPLPDPLLGVVDDRRGADALALNQAAADFAKYGKVTSGTAQAIGYSVKDYGIEWVQMAVRKGAGSSHDGEPGWNYIESILERWKAQGGPDEPKHDRPGKGREPTAKLGAGERIAAKLAAR